MMVHGLILAFYGIVIIPFFKALNKWVIARDPKLAGRTDIASTWVHPHVIWGTLGCLALLAFVF